MKMLEELLTFCCSPMQSTFPAVARQISLLEEIKGRDGKIERDEGTKAGERREVGGIEEAWESLCVRL